MSHTLLLGIAMIAAAVGPVSENDAPPSTARTILGRVDAFEYMRSAQLDPRESLARGEPGTWRREFVDPRAMSSEGHDVVEWNTDLMLATTSSVLRWSAEQPFWERQFSYTRSRVLAVFEGDLIVAGWHPPANIHRWDGEQLVPLGAGIQGPFTAEATIVGALAELDGVLYAGGQFDSSAAQPLVNVARWDGAEWLPVGDNLTGRVDALTFHGGELFAAGTITVWDDGGNEVGQGVARFDGSRWQPVGQEAIGRIRVSVSDGSDLWAAGQFRVLGRSPVRAVARFDGVAWEPIGEFNNDIRDLVALPDGLWCCGHFSNMPHVARFDGSSWSSPGGGIPSAATVNKIFPWAGQLLFAGAFIDVADVATRNVSAWSPTEGWRAFGLGLDGEAFNTSMSSAGRVVAGDFVRAGGTRVNRIARLDVDRWRGFGDGFDGRVYDVIEYAGDIIAAGRFQRSGDDETAYIARWDGTSWSALGGGTDDFVYSLAIQDGLLYAGGSFSHAGPVEASGIAAWDGATWSPVAAGVQGGIPFGPSVYALLSTPAGLLVGGAFEEAGGSTASNVARVGPSGWESLGSGLPGWVLGLADDGADVLAAGAFAGNAARFDGAQWTAFGDDLPSNPHAIAVTSAGVAAAVDYGRVHVLVDGSWSSLSLSSSSWVNALDWADGELWMAGKFTLGGGFLAQNLTAWRPEVVRDLRTPTGERIASSFRLRENPFRDELTLDWAEPRTAPARLEVFDVRGRRLVRRVLDSRGDASSRVSFGTMPAGVYFVTVTNPDGSRTTRKAVRLR